MAHSAAYFQKLADRYEALASTMRREKDRETVVAIASQYLQVASELRRREEAASR